MDSTWHPPFAISQPGGAPSGSAEWAYGHVRLWVRLVIEPWVVVREGHLHLVRPLASGGSFAVVDLSRRPLVVVPDRMEPEGLREQIAASIEMWLRAWRPTFWRLPELDVVSELGESEARFRRRVQGVLHPELQRHLDHLQAPPLSRLPSRRRSQLERRRVAREQIAGALSRVMGPLEPWTVEDAVNCVRSLEAGLLLANQELLPSDHPPSPRQPVVPRESSS